MALDSMQEIFERMEQEGKPFWEVVLETDMERAAGDAETSPWRRCCITWQAMLDAADSYTGDASAPVSGLVGGDGMKMRQYCLRRRAP